MPDITTCQGCDRVHPAPSCADPACYREEAARKADGFLPRLGDLIRAGLLDPNMPTDDKTKEGAGALWRDQATILRGDPQSYVVVESPWKRAAGQGSPAPALALATAEKLPEYETVTTSMDVLISNTGQFDHLKPASTRARAIAASFQDMLRTAYQAGVASAATGEIFETWYQREVLL